MPLTIKEAKQKFCTQAPHTDTH